MPSTAAPSPHRCSRSAPAAFPPGAYVRARDLPSLLPLWPHELATPTPPEHARLLGRLRRALREERRRGLAGHWSYDLARHARLLRAYRAEVADYRRGITRAPSADRPG